MLLDMLDHFRIVVGRQHRFTFAAIRHWNVADEVGQPGKPGFLQLGVFVPVVIDVPGFIGDHEIVGGFFHRILEDHEILDEDLVHIAKRLEAVQFVFAAFELDMPRLARQPRTQGVDLLVAGYRGDA